MALNAKLWKYIEDKKPLLEKFDFPDINTYPKKVV